MPSPETNSSDAAIKGLATFNALSEVEARRRLQLCCGSAAWAEAVMVARPFTSFEHLTDVADRAWSSMPSSEWLAAFAHHPRIGEKNLAQEKFKATASQSSREQSGMNAASDDVRAEFVRLNQEYEVMFGHVFLICATGKSAAEMLEQLRRRLTNAAEQELHNAAAEQAKITRIRLTRLIDELGQG